MRCQRTWVRRRDSAGLDGEALERRRHLQFWYEYRLSPFAASCVRSSPRLLVDNNADGREGTETRTCEIILCNGPGDDKSDITALQGSQVSLRMQGAPLRLSIYTPAGKSASSVVATSADRPVPTGGRCAGANVRDDGGQKKYGTRTKMYLNLPHQSPAVRQICSFLWA